MQSDLGTDPVFRGWFASEISYTGRVNVVYDSPLGHFEGSAKITYDDFGIAHLISDVDTLDSPYTGINGLLYLLSKGFTMHNSQIVPARMMRCDNPSSSLSMSCEGGFLSGSGSVCQILELGQITSPKLNSKVELRPLETTYDVVGQQPGRYLVLPLTNFVSAFRDVGTELKDHPLRIVDQALYADTRTDNDIPFSEWRVRDPYRVITFLWYGRRAFIERLPDYADRIRALEEGRAKCKITAVMVLEMPNKADDSGRYKNLLLPWDLLPLLTLITGTPVGCPWVELRGGDGSLAMRSHKPIGCVPYRPGHRVIDETLDGGTGPLLTGALSYPEYRTPIVQSVLHHASSAAHPYFSLDDQLDHVFRALDGLSNHFEQYESITTEHDSRAQVKSILRRASKNLNALAATIKPLNSSQAEAVRRCSEQIYQVQHSKISFGRAVAKLIDHFHLHDAKVMTKYDESLGRKARKWTDEISLYRNRIMHDGYLDFSKEGITFNYGFILKRHLHDVLIRILLKSLGYLGTYRPPVAEYSGTRVRVDWVTSEVTASAFGYLPSTETLFPNGELPRNILNVQFKL